MESQILNDWIDRFVQDDLTESEMEVFAKMLSSNPLLRREVFLEQRLSSFLADREVIALREKISQTRKRPYFNTSRAIVSLVAATAVCLLTLGISYLIFRHEPGLKVQRNVSCRNQMVIDGKSVIPAHHVRPGETTGVESAPGRNVKNRIIFSLGNKDSTTNPFAFPPDIFSDYKLQQAVSPGADVKVPLNAKINFLPVNGVESNHALLVITDNRNRNLLTIPVPAKNRPVILAAKVLGRGIFFWKITDDNTIVTSGKVTVTDEFGFPAGR